MKLTVLIVLVLFSLVSAEENSMTNIYDFEVETISGEKINLGVYRGKVLLIVNVASKCGFTSQYDGLEKLYQEEKESGLVILGFPANNFMNQEPGTNEQIMNFCRLNYGVTFPMFSKISVKGKDIHPLYDFLTDKEKNPDFGGKISWNFNKFLISRDGEVINRFGSSTKPDNKKLVEAVSEALED
jgi:glutathione peroxidase